MAKNYEERIFNYIKLYNKSKNISEEYANIAYECMGEISICKTIEEVDKFFDEMEKKEFNIYNLKTYKEFKSKKELENTRIINPPDIKEGIYKCNKCNKNKTMHYQLQLRSCDEPMTTIIMCLECGKKWTE